MDLTLQLLVRVVSLPWHADVDLEASLNLLRTFYVEGLVDNRTFLVWIVQQQGSCNLAQTGFITRLADEYLEGIVGGRALARPFIDACLLRLSEV